MRWILLLLLPLAANAQEIDINVVPITYQVPLSNAALGGPRLELGVAGRLKPWGRTSLGVSVGVAYTAGVQYHDDSGTEIGTLHQLEVWLCPRLSIETRHAIPWVEVGLAGDFVAQPQPFNSSFGPEALVFRGGAGVDILLSHSFALFVAVHVNAGSAQVPQSTFFTTDPSCTGNFCRETVVALDGAVGLRFRVY
jgi:hypothetical protein